MSGFREVVCVPLLRKNYAVVSVGMATARQPANVIAQATLSPQRVAFVADPESRSAPDPSRAGSVKFSSAPW